MANIGEGEYRWIETPLLTGPDQQTFRLLHQGYLTLLEEPTAAVSKGGSHGPGQAAAAVSMRRSSDPSIKQGWKRRYCTLSQTAEGLHLLHYKTQSSFSSLESPCGVILLEQCTEIFENPRHPKFRNVLSIKFIHKTLSLYPDKESEMRQWLGVLQDALHLHEVSHLKGLPKQKVIRKDNQVEAARPKIRVTPDQKLPQPEQASGGKGVTCLSVRPVSEAERSVEGLKGLPKQKALRQAQQGRGGGGGGGGEMAKATGIRTKTF